MIYQLLTIAILLPVVAATLYYGFLAFAGLFARNQSMALQGPCLTKFAIVIPAYNEESVIAETLDSCRQLEYPKELFSVFVVADNCSDRTAQVAQSYGVNCLERSDLDNRGKGNALEWAFEKILPLGHEVIVVVDADCQMDRKLLKSFDSHVSSGARVLQSKNEAGNPDENPISYFVAIANRLENDFYYAPKSRCGLTVLLRGTGQAFHRDVLEQIEWKASSIVEDIEYSIELIKKKIKVVFVNDVAVRSRFPANKNELGTQRSRWVGGSVEIMKTYGFHLLFSGLFRGKLAFVDAGWSLLVNCRAIILLMTFAAIVMSGMTTLLYPGKISSGLFIVAVFVLASQGCYFLAGALHLGMTRKRLLYLISAPVVLFQHLAISLFAFMKVKAFQTPWKKRPDLI